LRSLKWAEGMTILVLTFGQAGLWLAAHSVFGG
jgi:hypothetical protein